MVLMKLDDETHARLWQYKLDNKIKSHSLAVARLLDIEEFNQELIGDLEERKRFWQS